MSVLQFGSAREWTYLEAHASAQIPRYTSYPPANRFSPTISAVDAAQALRALPAQGALSLYLHIPFCKKLCWYCGCHTSVPTIADPVQSYVDALVAEMDHVAGLLPASMRVTHIHFGGGSPDILQPHQVRQIFAAVRKGFRIDTAAEIAAELDPRGVSPEVVDAFVAGGLNRVSLGVQVLDPGVQARINRVQSRAVVDAAIDSIRRAGISHLNIDIMYGLPGQTREHVVETALFAATRNADRIATFGYAHVPWMKRHQKGIAVADLPAGEARFRQAEAAAVTLMEAGYTQIGFDHFAAPNDALAIAERAGHLRRNFQGYTDDNAIALIGFGASAISSLPGLIYQNASDTAAYREQTAAGLPVARGVKLTEADVRTGRVIEKILCDFAVNVPGDLLIAACPLLSPMIMDGLAELSGTRLTVTERGRPYVRNIASCFDRDFHAAPARHSIAV